MGTAADILENAAELTKRYGKTVTSEPPPARAHVVLCSRCGHREADFSGFEQTNDAIYPSLCKPCAYMRSSDARS